MKILKDGQRVRIKEESEDIKKEDVLIVCGVYAIEMPRLQYEVIKEIDITLGKSLTFYVVDGDNLEPLENKAPFEFDIVEKILLKAKCERESRKIQEKLSEIGKELVKEAAKTEKPTLGVLPKYLWLEDRANDIKEAIERKVEAKQEVPKEWVIELIKLSPSIVVESIKFRWA